MSSATPEIDYQRIDPIIAEFKQTISEHFPGTEFEQYLGEDPDGVYLIAIVDLEDPDEVIDLIIDRLVDVQTEDRLPLHVAAVQTRARTEAALQANPRQPAEYSVLDALDLAV